MKLVVCDDDPVIRYLLEVVLAKRGGHDVTAIEHAADVASAVAGDLPDLVLLDFMMPGLSGLDVASELAADPATSSVPVVFLTGRADIDLVSGIFLAAFGPGRRVAGGLRLALALPDLTLLNEIPDHGS